MTANVDNFKEMLKSAEGSKKDMSKAFDRIRAYLASSILGRDFNESPSEYLNRKPAIKAIHDWAETVVISPDYKIVKY